MGMIWHPLELLRIIFVVLVTAMVIVGLTTRARPRSRRDWGLLWAVLVFLAWALLGFGWLRSR
jgi:TctA family transporter